jgi:DNA (cytosine-5)-methyltransferase 1
MVEGSGTRSSLFYEQLRIWNESGAPYLLWENVPGALSSHRGRDFAALLSAIVGATVPVPAGGWRSGGVAAGRDAVAAWRLLDLQHFGVPQQRLRVVVLAARTGGADPAEVLALGDDGVHSPTPRFAEREAAERRLSRRHTLDDGEQAGFFRDAEADAAIGVPLDTEAPKAVAPANLVGAYRHEGTQTACVFGPGGIRLMMPVERERISGLPDDWTRWGRYEDGTIRELSDQQRYRLTGNLVGVEFGEWICCRLARAHEALGR